MTEIEKKVMDLFQELKTGKGALVKPMALELKMRHWDVRDQDGAKGAFESLIKRGYLSIQDNWYVLTEAGYNYIYQGYSLADTEEELLHQLRPRKLRVGNVIVENWFLNWQRSTDRFHFDHYSRAFENLVKDGILEEADGRWRLTQAGYDRLYPE